MSGPVPNVSGQLMTSPYTKTPISFVLPKGACVMIGLFLGTSKLLEYTWASLVASDRSPLRGLVLCMQEGSRSHRSPSHTEPFSGLSWVWAKLVGP